MSQQRPPGSVPNIWASAERPAFRKSFALELDDHLAILHASRQLLPTGLTVGAVGLVALFVSLFTNFDKLQAGDVVTFIVYEATTIGACTALTYLLLKPARQFLRSMYRRRLAKAGVIGKPVESTVDTNGISYTVLGQTVTCTWDSLYALEEDEGTFHFWMSKLASHPWPSRVFSSEEERQDFRDSVLKWSGRPFSAPVLARLGAAGRANLGTDGGRDKS
ncbi:YcxB family protein [Rhizobium ecuadorense]|uniref:YcxB family protein n=1 Tax=Rhizobium ecuadorense TaxID=1671795 RepID=UPI0006734F2F|nr:YcxB family protein [Rhizobium ecuadorense]